MLGKHLLQLLLGLHRLWKVLHIQICEETLGVAAFGSAEELADMDYLVRFTQAHAINLLDRSFGRLDVLKVNKAVTLGFGIFVKGNFARKNWTERDKRVMKEASSDILLKVLQATGTRRFAWCSSLGDTTN
jgi:hypothetical protein